MIRFLFCISLMSATSAWAYSTGSSNNVRLDVGYMMLNQKQNPSPDSAGNVTGSDSDSRLSYLDLKLGYIFSNDIYGGLLYSTYSSSSNGAASLSPTRSLLGATIGYHSSGYFLDASYFFNGKLNDSVASGSEFNSPSGFALDFGYDFMLGTNFYLGVEVSYKAITFKKYKPAGLSEVSTSWNQSELYPMLKLGFVF